MSEKNFVPCAFVNGNPVKFGPDQGFLVEESVVGEKKFLTLSVMRQTYYEHPDAPNDAILSVIEPSVVTRAFEGDEDYPNLMMLFMAQKAISKICKR